MLTFIRKRKPATLADALAKCGFSAEKYIELYKDLEPLADNREAIAQHYLDFGRKEGRILQMDTSVEEVIRRLHETGVAQNDGQVILASHAQDCMLREFKFQRFDEYGTAAPYLDYVHMTDSAQMDRYGIHHQHVIGDSHSAAYSHATYPVKHGLWISWLVCTGGSARGLANRTSRSGYRQTILDHLASIKKTRNASRRVLFCFGQVDLEFVYYHRWLSNDLTQSHFDFMSYHSFIVETVDLYVSFLLEVIEAGFSVSAVGVLPPCIETPYLKRLLTSLEHARATPGKVDRRLLRNIDLANIPDLRARTFMHHLFNQELRRKTGDNGIPFHSIFDELLAKDGTVGLDYLSIHGMADHHLGYPSFQDLSARMLKAAAAEASASGS